MSTMAFKFETFQRTRARPRRGPWFVNFRVGEPNKPAVMGGFVRCRTRREAEQSARWFKRRGASVYVEASG